MLSAVRTLAAAAVLAGAAAAAAPTAAPAAPALGATEASAPDGAGSDPGPPRVTDPGTAPALPPALAAPVAPVRGAIAGRVLLADSDVGLPAIEVVVRGPGVVRHALTGDDGSFRVDDLPSGRYQVEASADGAAPARAEVVAAGGEARVDLSLALGETIQIEERWRGAAQRLRDSAEAVAVVETDRARRESADLGEVLRRHSGVAVRRSGGVGSEATLALAGLSGDHVPIFVDGVPIAMAGYALGFASVPVNLIEQVEIYRGVVPIRFGADALGGAVNLATDGGWHGTRAAASYQLGS